MQNVGEREPITKDNISMIARTLGFGSMILNLHLTDYSRGAVQKSNHEKCFWLTDGRRVDISMKYGTIVASMTNEPDENIPEPL